MKQQDQIVAFLSDLEALVCRYAAEFDLPAVTAVGCLQLQAQVILNKALEENDEEDDD